MQTAMEVEDEPQPSTSGTPIKMQTDSESITFSSPFKQSTPSKSSPFKPGSSDEATTTTTTETESETEQPASTNNINKVISQKDKILQLFKRCQTCGKGIISKRSWNVGAKCVISWECVMGHTGHWSSSDDIRGMPAINLEIASAIVFSGSTFQVIHKLATLLNIPLFNKTTFNSIQNSYILPVINNTYNRQYFENMALLVTRSLEGESISLMGDGRSDSPGFSAKYTTYSMMEELTQKIVEMKLIQVTESTSSVAMEKEGFLRSMESILAHGVKINTLTTDRSPSIRKTTKDDFTWINHQFDCWHICKGVKKKCLMSGRKKGNDILLKWTKSITNHLWYSCSACGGDPVELKRLWQSILHHVTGIHQWEDEDGTVHSCQHSPFTTEEQDTRRWFDPLATAYRDLKAIVMDTRLNRDLSQLTLFKHTSGLESYHSSMLKFAPKRLHFHYASMHGRMQLAVIDHNFNTGREAATTKTGKPVYRVDSSKLKGGEWTAKKVSQPKSYQYAHEMVANVLQRRQDPSIVYGEKESYVDLPKMPQNIAKQPRPSLEELLAKKHN